MFEKWVSLLEDEKELLWIDCQHDLRKLFPKEWTLYSKVELRRIYKQICQMNPGLYHWKLDRLFTKKIGRSESGIVNVSIVLRPDQFSCKFDCHFCPSETKKRGAMVDMPRSYLSTEDAVRRAHSVHFDPIEQVNVRLRTLSKNGHPLDKIEVRILGGTFSSYPHDYVEDFIRHVYYAINTFYDVLPKRQPDTLEKEQFLNEENEIHIVGLGIETRPDCITWKEIKRLRFLGCTRVELGVQHTDDELLRKVNRGHTLDQSRSAITRLKNAGFKIEIHIMTDLPGSTPQKDKDCYQQILQTDSDLCPDYLKDYPCLDVPFTKIREWKKNAIWNSYAEQDIGLLENVLIYRQSITPRWVRVNRVQRDFPHATDTNFKIGYESNTHLSNLSQIVHQKAETMGIYCQCIRCCQISSRDVMSLKHISNIHILYTTYSFMANNEQEYFIVGDLFIKNQNRKRPCLCGFIRVRILSSLSKKTAIIRELHVYGNVIPISGNVSDCHGIQHQGIGKTLLQKAESIAFSKHGCERLYIISAIGTRQYYRKYGYNLEDTYMVKYKLKTNSFFYHSFYLKICIVVFLVLVFIVSLRIPKSL